MEHVSECEVIVHVLITLIEPEKVAVETRLRGFLHTCTEHTLAGTAEVYDTAEVHSTRYTVQQRYTVHGTAEVHGTRYSRGT